MRNIILSLLMSCLFLGLSAQEYQVSTEVQTKNVLLEEFTGFSCGFCPDGHKKADRLKQILGNRISVVAIHCGYFAQPRPGDPDFIVDAGLEIGDFLQASNGSFPSGAVNRRDWQGDETYPNSRGLWLGYARQIVEEQAPVNLWGRARIDAQTREMKIRVEGYFTEDVTGELPRLTVLLTQNNILGLQYGGAMGDRYPHQHMLRDAVSDAMGDELLQHSKGEYFVKEYTYQLPEKVKHFAVVPEEVELVTFVTRGKVDVLNALTIKPDYVGEALPLSAGIASHKIAVNGGYRYNFVPVMLTNKSNMALTSAKFDITLNGVTTESEWRGEVAPFATSEIRVPVDWGTTAVGSNVFQITLKGLNGEACPSDGFSGIFYAPATLPANILLRIRTNDSAGENTYTLYDMDGQVIKTLGPFENGLIATYEENLNLEPGKTYCLEITDYWGNGVYVAGNAVEFVNQNGLCLLQQTDILDFGVRVFFKTDVPSGIEHLQQSASPAELYDVRGQRVQVAEAEAAIDYSRLMPGVYVLRVGTISKKIVVK